MFKHTDKQNKNTSVALSTAKKKNSGQRGFYLEDSRPQSFLGSSEEQEIKSPDNRIDNINNHPILTDPLQLMISDKVHQSEPEKEKQKEQEEDASEAIIKLNKYFENVPEDVLNGPDKVKWQQARDIIHQLILEKKPLPPNPYSAEQEHKILYRGTSLVNGSLYQGSAGSVQNTPTTPSAEIAALFALKAKNEGHTGVVGYGAIKTIKEAGMGFSAPDTMSSQEQEITVKASPTELGSHLIVSKIEEFVKALQTVGIDYTKYIGSGIQSGGEFDRLVSKAKNLPVNSEKQLIQFLKKPELIEKWKDLTEYRKEIIDKLKTQKTTIDIKTGKRKNKENEYHKKMIETYELFIDTIKEVNTGTLFLLEDLEQWRKNYEGKNLMQKTTDVKEELEKQITNYDNAEKKDDESQDDSFDSLFK